MSEEDIQGRLHLYGGASIILEWGFRESTRDIDATLKPKEQILRLARNLAQEESLPEDWINDSVKGFIDKQPSEDEFLTVFDFSNLLVVRPPAEYLLAMKAQSARIGKEEHDHEDLKFLMRETGITDQEKVFELIEEYYPNRPMEAKVKYFVESIAEEIDE